MPRAYGPGCASAQCLSVLSPELRACVCVAFWSRQGKQSFTYGPGCAGKAKLYLPTRVLQQTLGLTCKGSVGTLRVAAGLNHRLGNLFDGPLPDLRTNKMLHHLSMNSNGFIGSIPKSLASAKLLFSIDLSNNQ
eukprot:1136834-Pelagomonas_calceolata.AAC.1